jgi:hypothetical protein
VLRRRYSFAGLSEAPKKEAAVVGVTAASRSGCPLVGPEGVSVYSARTVSILQETAPARPTVVVPSWGPMRGKRARPSYPPLREGGTLPAGWRTPCWGRPACQDRPEQGPAFGPDWRSVRRP